MSEKNKKFSIIFWISAFFVWLLISVFFVDRFLEPFIESFLSRIISEVTLKTYNFWVKVFETIVMSIIGMLATYYFRILVRDNLKETHQEILEELGKNSSDNAYLAYQTIITHTKEMKELVNKLVNLPRHPDLMKILIEDYSRKAANSKFLVDFPTFLKLAEIFVKNSKEMYFVNTTPPYEWWYPIRFEKNKEIKEAIKQYKKKIEDKLKEGSKISRITIIETNKQKIFDMALTSMLEYGIYKYFNTLGIELTSPDVDENIVGPIVAWMQSILRALQTELTQTNKTLDNILNILNLQDNSIDRFKKLLSSYWDNSKFNCEFKKLSRDISGLILKKFAKLHNPINEAFYILKDKISDNKKDDIINWAKEEGIFKDSSGNMYLLRIEEANGVNVLLVTIRSVEHNEDTHFSNLMNNFIKDPAEKSAIGNLKDLLN